MARKTGSRSKTGKTPDQTGVGADSLPSEVTPVGEVAQPPRIGDATPVGGDSLSGADAGPWEKPGDEPPAGDPASETPDTGNPDTGMLPAGATPEPAAGPDGAAPGVDLIPPQTAPEAGSDPADRGPADAPPLAPGLPEQPDIPAGPDPEPVLAPPSTETAGGTPPPPAAPPRAAAGSAVPLVLGGIVAAVLGALVVLFLLPQGWQGGTDPALANRIAALENRAPVIAGDAVTAEQVQALEARLAALESAVSDQPEAPQADLTPLEDRLAALEESLAALEAGTVTPDQLNAAVGALTTRQAGLEESLVTRIDTAVETAMAGARADIATRAEGLEAREEDVAAAQALVARRAALAGLIAAADSGEAAPQALADLPDAPAALAPLGQGIATLPGLQQQFAPAARAALRADPVPPDASLFDRLRDFTRSQTGARSLAPRDGDDTDAVLSRAEAAVRAGDLATALSELDALTGEPAAAMADWRRAAEERLAALAALRDVQAQLDNGE